MYYVYDTETYFDDAEMQNEIASITVPSRIGYIFGGYYTDAECIGRQYIDADGAFVNDPFTAITASTVLYAKWTPIDYTIDYDYAGGTATGNVTVYNIESEPITLVNPTLTGYLFSGWVSDYLAEPTIDVTIPTGSIGNRVYTATWTPITYTVAFDPAGGEGAPAAITKTYDAPAVLPLVEPTRPGYVFACWKYGDDIYYPGDTLTRDYTTTHLDTVTLTAFWNYGNYNVSYNGDVTGDTEKIDGIKPATITIVPNEGYHLTSVTQVTSGGIVLTPDLYTAQVAFDKRSAAINFETNAIIGDVVITAATAQHNMVWRDEDENNCRLYCEVCNEPGATQPHIYMAAWTDAGDGLHHSRPCTTCGHITYADHFGGTATCTVQKTCTDCGAKYGELLPHVCEGTAAVAPTCTTRGMKEYWTCVNCQNLFSDAQGTQPVAAEDLVIDTIPHQFEGAIKNNGNGTHSFLCTLGCGLYGGAVSHVYDREVANETYFRSSGECTEPAQYYKSCACGAKGTDTFEGAPIGHNYVNMPGLPATCYEAGYTEYKECSRCSDIQGKQTIAALGHGSYLYDSSGSGKVYDGTFEWSTYSCSRGCGDHFTLFTIHAKDNANRAVAGAKVTINGQGLSASGTTDRTGTYASDTHFTDGEYTITIDYKNGDKTATTTGQIRLAGGRSSGGIGALTLVDTPAPNQGDSNSNSQSSSGGFRCSMCDSYDASRGTAAGFFIAIPHFFVHLIQRILYAFRK